jgi:hypothetical protein
VGEILEVDAHDHTAQGGMRYLDKTCVGEDAAETDMKLDRENSLPWFQDHRVALDGAGAMVSGVVDGSASQGATHSAATEAGTCEETGHGPNSVVVLVLGSALPGHTSLQQQPRVGGAGLDRTPTDRLVFEVGDQTRCGARLGMTRVGLGAQPESQLIPADRRPGLPRLHLVSLALARVRSAAGAEHGLEIVPALLVGWNDRDIGRRRVAYDSTVAPSIFR